MTTVDTLLCPKCGAPLPAAAGAHEVHCPYCGTIARLHETTQMPAFPVAPGSAAGAQPSRARPRIVLFSVLSVLLLVAVGVSLIGLPAAMHKSPGTGVGSATGLGSSVGGDNLTFDDTPMLADANGDGVPDVIGHAKWGDDEYLAAFEGASGKLLWKTKGSKESFAGKRALVGTVMVNVDELGKVQAYRISNGTPAWAGLLSDKADTFCQDGSSAIIGASDNTFTRFDLATGKKDSVDLAGKKHPKCTSVYQSRGSTPKFTLVDWPDFHANNLPELNGLPGMSAHRALVPTTGPTTGGGISFLLGSRESGSQVAMVAAVEHGNVLWKLAAPQRHR